MKKLFLLLVIFLLYNLAFIPNIFPQETKLIKRVMTYSEFQKFKNLVGTYEKGKNYNQIINGHGTGLVPPTEEQWEEMKNQPILVDKIEYPLRKLSTPASHDNSATNWFPPIGNQGSEGSCASWACVYYTKTFQEAKEHNWDLSGCVWEGFSSGHPSVIYQDKIFSPDFIYHQVNNGNDSGSYPGDNMSIMHRIGCCTWDKMPNNPSDHTTWPTENAWRQAPLYRSQTNYIMPVGTDLGIEDLKLLLVNGNLGVILVDANFYDNFTTEDLWTKDNYTTFTSNHANTIVGYDDNFGPYNESGNSNVYGAFKVANSWGVGTGNWENVADGFYYISYKCMKEKIKIINTYQNFENYAPKIVAVFKMNHDFRKENKIDFGVLDPLASTVFKPLYNFTTKAGDYPYPNNPIVIDITDLIPYMPESTNQTFFMTVNDRGTTTTGTIQYFSVEMYDDYTTGIPSSVYVSAETPVSTLQDDTVWVSIFTSPETINITYPAGGEAFEIGSNPLITYCSSGNSGFVNLDLSTDGGLTWDIIAANQPDNGDYSGWIVPNTPSGNCKIRITDVDGYPSAISNAFSIMETDLNRGLIAFYPFNKNANDESGNGHNGTVAGGTSWSNDRFNNPTSALSFDGITGSASIPHSDKFNYTNYDTLSFSIWFCINQHVQWGGLICKGDNISNYCISGMSDGSLEININHYSSASEGILTTSSFPLNEWHHLVVIFTPSHVQLFVDGQFNREKTYTNLPLINNEPLYFGVDADGDWEYLKGRLDDIRIYNRALNAAEILKLYNEPVKPSSISITYPAGGEIFEIGSNPLITYSSTDNSGFINLDLSTDGGITWDTIATNQVDKGEYTGWLVPNTPSANCKIRVADVDGNPSAISNGVFRIGAEEFSEDTSIFLSPMENSSAVWGDYDNDNDLDILLTGIDSVYYHLSKIYRNNGNNTFSEQTSILLEGGNSAVWGDYDNDGFLDILMLATAASKIFRNNGDNTFTEQTSINNIIGVYNGSADWGDYDNDGDLDILLTGMIQAPYQARTKPKVYKNNGDNTFTDQAIPFDTFGSSVSWGDYDNDGDLDILLNFSGSIEIYSNNGDNVFIKQTAVDLDGSGVWGDYDNDGDLDIISVYGNILKVYQNNGANTFSDQITIPLPLIICSSVSLGDYDNDGDLDILLVGLTTGWDGVAIVYKNHEGNTFTEQTSILLTHLEEGSAAWADYDNDDDLDIILTGNGSKLYRNNIITKNTPPSAPSNLKSAVNGNDVTFSWDKSTDNETPQNGLKYNLVVGSSPDACNILSPMSDRNTGYRRIINLGNTNHDTSWAIKGLAYGKYYWSAQAIDNCFAGSAFAETQSFTIQAPETIIITYPAGGDTLLAGSNPVITYSSLGNSGYVNLDYSTDSGVTWDTIATNQLDDGDYHGWIVPNILSANCKIRISDVDGDPSTISDGLFTITDIVPVELVSFTANPGENKIMLNWETATELNNYGFEIERMLDNKLSNQSNPEFLTWEKIGFVQGSGNSTSSKSYSYIDKYPTGGSKFEYRLKQIDINGSFDYSNSVEADITPKEYELYQNYPNPFNPYTNIKFSLPQAEKVKICIYNSLGEKVLLLVDKEYEAGVYNIELNTSGFASGIYFYSITASNFSQTKKMVLAK